jgi:hypothetical protein
MTLVNHFLCLLSLHYRARSYYEVTRSFWSTSFLYGRKIAVAGDRTIVPVGPGSRELFRSSPLLVQPWLGWLGRDPVSHAIVWKTRRLGVTGEFTSGVMS